MKGHLVVWSLVRPVATQLGRVYHILCGTIYRRRISYDGQWGGKWGGQPKDYFSWHRGRRYKETIVRIGGPPFSIMRYVNNLISVPIFKAIIKKASQSSRIADKPLLSKHAMAGWNVSEGICRDNVNFLTAPLCEKPSIIAHQTGLCWRTHILAADVDCLAFFGWGRGVK